MRHKLVIAFLCIAACGGNGKPEISANKDNVCSQIASVTCYNLYQCCSEGQIESFLKVSDPRTEQDCITDVTRLCNQQIGLVDASIKAGRVTFDSATMNACLKALVAPDGACSSVDSMLPWATACMNSAWVGAVAVGSKCTQTFECANPTSAFCAPNQTCTALPTDGMPCANVPGTGQRCADGFFCGNGTCRAQVAAGGMCQSNQECQKGNFCNNAQPRVCEAVHSAGQACTSNQACQSNRCLPGVCSGSTQGCLTSADCQFLGHCSNNANMFCTTDGNCGAGTCSVSGATCTTQAQCAPAGGTCMLPNTCVLSTCTGNIVCADTQVEADYCTNALAAIPAPP